ncbi:MAG: DNA-3-methyladenine glycosylase I [Candidatus Pacebacteria bacterium]|nr:DNA-3-methyladenine glycosylase I [Candidatus Paceibacterota bacterium]
MKKDLKKIFNLMFEKLELISIGDNFINDINKRRSVCLDKNKPDSFFYEMLVVDIHVSGFKVSILRDRWSDIRKAFSDYDVCRVSQYTDRDLEKMMNNPRIIKNKNKLKACIENAKLIKEISNKYGSFGNYLNKYSNNPEKLIKELINNFHYMGKVSALNYLNMIGMDAVKPDVHVIRIMYRLGLIDSDKGSPEDVEQSIEVANEIKNLTGEKLKVVDAIFWMYGGGGDNHVKKAICSKQKPLCCECPLTDYCDFFKSQKIE